MKIAIPVNEKNDNPHISNIFGRSKYFLIHNTDENLTTFIENEGIDAQGGAGIKAAQNIIDIKVNVLIANQLGENAIEVLNNSNILLFKPKNEFALENISKLLNNELEKY